MKEVANAKKYIKSLDKSKTPNAKKEAVIIDCDPGIDDALALLLLAENLDKVEIKLLTSCAGNTPIDITTKNLQFFASNFFNGVRVAKGSKLALVKHNALNADDVHGVNGLGDYAVGEQDYPYEDDAVEAMYDVLQNSEEKIVIVALGPMTNIAKLVIMHPEIKEKIKCVYSMIGSIKGDGNITSYSEFNAYFDPEAFDLVVKSGLRLILNPMELGNETRIKKTVFAKMPTENMKDNFVKILVESINETVDPTCICLYDPNTIIALVNPELYEFVPCDVRVYTSPEIGGKTTIENNKEGKHFYQKVKDKKELDKYVLKTLFHQEFKRD